MALLAAALEGWREGRFISDRGDATLESCDESIVRFRHKLAISSLVNRLLHYRPMYSPSWLSPPARLSLAEDEIAIWQVPLDDEAANVAELEGDLSKDERVRASRFYFPRDRNRFIVARGTLRRLLARYLDMPAGELRFRYGPQGKPAIETSDSSPINFNVSHTSGLALFGFSSGRTIGIDLERIRCDFRVEEIAKRYFSDSEVKQLLALSQDARAEAFFLCWTRKEAYIKARGEGLHMELNSFDVTLTPGQSAYFACGVDPSWQMEAFWGAEKCPAALVYPGPKCALHFFATAISRGLAT